MVKRTAPPDVPPVVIDGVRYEAPTDGRDRDLDQDGGYIFARDDATGAQLWSLKVYDTGPDPAGMQVDVYITSMKKKWLRPQLAVKNERGDSYTVHLDTRTVTS